MSLSRPHSSRVLLVGALVLHCCSVVTAAVVTTEVAAAEEPAVRESAPARLFHEGRALMVDGRFAEACPRLEASQHLEPRLGTQLNIAFCYERLGKLATAWSGFQQAADQARREGDVAREQFATERSLALAPRVPWLDVRVAGGGAGDPPTILLDGARLASSALGQELPVDAGAHVLIATHGDPANGSETNGSAANGGVEYWRTTVVLRESEHAKVTIPAAPATVALGPSQPASESATHPFSRFVFEVGAFVAFIAVDAREATAEDPASIRTVLRDENGATELVSCASVVCEYPYVGASAGVVLGVAGFVGYALTEPMVDLGLRFLLGPRPGGGALAAIGPSASIPLSERYRVGPTVFVGTASHVVSDNVQLSTPSGVGSVDTRLHGTLGFAWGFGAELGLTLSSSPSGSLVLQATPLYLFGSNGSAWSLPLGAAYHWN